MFDQAAASYDSEFTHSEIGKRLRSQVYKYISEILKPGFTLNILELNCGTGEDAIYFGKLGHSVLATDISSNMIAKVEDKTKANQLEGKVKCDVCDLRDLSQLKRKNFDLVFSNFGGLNCISLDDLKAMSHQISYLLNPGGRFIAVVMPRFCLMESLYFLFKFQFSEVFRRNTTHPRNVNVSGENIPTWYFSPSEFESAFANNFEKVRLRPVGITLPPSYLESWFKRKPNFLNFLEKLEQALSAIPVFSYVADHFLIDLKKHGK